MEDEKKCTAKVYEQGRWGSFHPHRCRYRVWEEYPKDGYCKIHHPITKELREKKSWEKAEARREKDPWVLLAKAQQTIRKLEAELEALRPIPQKR